MTHEECLRAIPGGDTGIGAACAWVLDELNRKQEKLEQIHAMLPALQAHLPAGIFGELAAHIYVLPHRPPTEDDIRRGREIAAELAGPQAS